MMWEAAKHLVQLAATPAHHYPTGCSTLPSRHIVAIAVFMFRSTAV